MGSNCCRNTGYSKFCTSSFIIKINGKELQVRIDIEFSDSTISRILGEAGKLMVETSLGKILVSESYLRNNG